MRKHLRANLWLLGLTLILCSVLYPLVLWLIGRTVFPSQANGSLVDKNGRPAVSEKEAVGSRLIAQPFTGDEYFQPRPSAVNYNAAASGASNYGANNPRLRGRVAQQLGPIVRYFSSDGPGAGALVGPDIEKWFQSENDPKKGEKRRDLIAEWASKNPTLLGDWAKASDVSKGFIKQWAMDHAGVSAAWKKRNPDAKDAPESDSLAPFFFDPTIADSFVALHPGMWPCTIDAQKDGKSVKFIKPMNEGDEVRSIFFDMWLQEHSEVKLEKVPADMVTMSGSGLDPHITLKNAHYQMPRVVKKWAEKTGAKETDVRKEIEHLLTEHSEAPFDSWVGVPLINVLEVNLALPDRMKRLRTKGS
jgi:K+-transporting ATPase ATPase C chain